jgi:hypothetical protein
LIDRCAGDEILKVISPLGVEASLQAIEKVGSAKDARHAILKRQLEQQEYEAQRAFEQYDEVDPRNRLVASELESRWNLKLSEVASTKAKLEQLRAEAVQLSSDDRERLLALGKDFAAVWRNENCPMKLKKHVAQILIEEIIAKNENNDTLQIVIHWKGGIHTELIIDRPKSRSVAKTSVEVVEIIRKMAVRYGDDQIASVLNQHGHHTGRGKRWNQDRVKSARRNYSIAGQKRKIPDPEILTLTQAAQFYEVSEKTILKLIDHGVLEATQVVARAPWEIRRSSLRAEPVTSIIEHLKTTGKLIIDRGLPDNQVCLPLENKGDDNDRYNV